MPIEEYAKIWSDWGITDLDVLEKRSQALIQTLAQQSAKRTPAPQSIGSLADIQAWLGDCQRCGLCQGRSHLVFGEGSAGPRLLFIGEAPGTEEDASGRPFAGSAGQLLDRILQAMGYRRADVYIANIVKCRPPENRTPKPEEIASCLPFLRAQIDLLSPRLIVALGLTAAKTLLQTEKTMANLRGHFQPLFWNPGISVMPTYHPAYLLRNPEAKKIVWEDMKQVKTRLELLN